MSLMARRSPPASWPCGGDLRDHRIRQFLKRLGGGNEAPSYICWGQQPLLLRIRTSRARAIRPAWSSVRSTRGQPVPGVLGAAGRRPGRHRAAADAASRPATTSGSSPTPNERDGPSRCPNPGRGVEDQEVRLRGRRDRRARVRVLPAQQAPGMERDSHQVTDRTAEDLPAAAQANASPVQRGSGTRQVLGGCFSRGKAFA